MIISKCDKGLDIKSRPTPGKTMLRLIKEHGKYLHQAYIILIGELKSVSEVEKKKWLEKGIQFRHFEASRGQIDHHTDDLVSSSLLLSWLCGRILNRISLETTLLDAEMWFYNSPHDFCISRNLTEITQQKILSLIQRFNIGSLLKILPYLCEVFETGNESAEQKGSKRVKKKSNGIYYTPSDVVDFIVDRSIKNMSGDSKLSGELQWYDPAVGTGSFLISILKQFSSSTNCADSYELATYCKENLFGTDISPLALQSTVYLLATSCMLKDNQGDLAQFAKTIGENLVLIDATTITDGSDLEKLFPRIKRGGVDFIVSNPPYSKRQLQQLNIFNEKISDLENGGDNLYPDFIKLLIDLPNKNSGGGGMVVPLSLTYSSNEKFRKLRKYIQGKNASIEFWNFDRTPDSLFGDDVKTRNTIIFYKNANKTQIKSTPLHRWNSRNRDQLFNSIPIWQIDDNIQISQGVPKIGDKIGVQILNNIISANAGILSEFIRTDSNSPEIITKTTAYNWIPVQLCTGILIGDKNSGEAYWRIKASDATAPMIYAVLNSRITYWLWRVWSDGFHLTNQFVHSLPFGKKFFDKIDKHQFERLGIQLWEKVKSEVIISKNAGIISQSFCPLSGTLLLDEIDKMIADYFELPIETSRYLKDYISELIIAGRNEEKGIAEKIKYLESIN
jgi:hypothetical protein